MGPRRIVLPDAEFILYLGLRQVAAAIPVFQLELVQILEMPLERLPDQRRSIHFVALRGKIRRPQKLLIQYNLYRFHCGLPSTVYFHILCCEHLLELSSLGDCSLAAAVLKVPANVWAAERHFSTKAFNLARAWSHCSDTWSRYFFAPSIGSGSN